MSMRIFSDGHTQQAFDFIFAEAYAVAHNAGRKRSDATKVAYCVWDMIEKKFQYEVALVYAMNVDAWR